ncbi:sensor histidine kinase [Nocardiopsis algeriensis]|uniref:histidine kinase n=1 Tax=Nocardiopsis algeriensis TaxID=1478215 RepID=A0A841IN38_9ACTN|nr:HAMP domain-containing sensor histidine kinase [Nocardiopsis algeriensis]MBB6119590.1 signal transduction histidine kinase [Nocardiopsis algeriensis]
MRPRSIRAKVTVWSIVMLMVIMGVALFLTSLLLRQIVASQLLTKADQAALQVAEDIAERTYEGPIPATEPILRIQILDRETGEVLAASQALTGRPALTGVETVGSDLRMDATFCTEADDQGMEDCYMLVGYPVYGSAYGDVVILAATTAPHLVVTSTLELVMFGVSLTLLTATAAVVWWGVGRTLSPVRRISAEMEHISATNLHRRLPVPNTDDEIAVLASTANASLERLEEAVTRQRRFISDASHELRNPIAGMITKIEVELAAPHPDPREREQTLQDLLSDTLRLENIVTDLLEVSRLESEVAKERRTVDMCALVAEELTDRHRRVVIRTHSCGEAWVKGSRVRLARVLTNLIANAERHARSRIDVTVDREGDNIVVEVHDDGSGVPESERERIFERFSRLKESRERDPEGSGLGLAISREIAEAKGGTLVAGQSSLLGGAVFTLTLPAVRSEPPQT